MKELNSLTNRTEGKIWINEPARRYIQKIVDRILEEKPNISNEELIEEATPHLIPLL